MSKIFDKMFEEGALTLDSFFLLLSSRSKKKNQKQQEEEGNSLDGDIPTEIGKILSLKLLFVFFLFPWNCSNFFFFYFELFFFFYSCK